MKNILNTRAARSGRPNGKVDSAFVLRRSASALGTAAMLLLGMHSVSAQAPNFTWNGGGADGNWTNSANWVGGIAPTSPQQTFDFAGTTNLNAVNNFSNYSAGNQIFFDSGAGAFTLSGNAIDFYDYNGTTSRIENKSTSLQTITFQVDVDNLTMSLIAGSGNLTFSGSNFYLNNNAGLVATANTNKIITISDAIQNGGGASVGSATFGTALDTSNGAGTVILNGTNTYTGDTYVNAGILQLGTSSLAMGSLASSYIRLGDTAGSAGATFALGVSTGGQTVSNAFNVRSGSSGVKTISANNTSGTDTLAGNIYLDNGLTLQNSAGGILNLTGTTDFKAQTLTFNPSGTMTASGALTSSLAAGGSLVKTGAGTLILQNTSNSYSGTSSGSLNANSTQINQGTLGIYGDGSLGVVSAGAYNNIQFTGSGTLQDTVNNISLNANRNISIANGATATFDTNGNTFTVNGIINSNSAANIIVTGSGTLAVTNATTLQNSSTWTVQNGVYNSTTGLYGTTLAIAGGNILGNSTGNVLNLNGGTLQFTQNGGGGYLNTRTINVGASGGAISDGGFAPGDATSTGGTIGPSITIASGSGLNLVSSNKFNLYSPMSGSGGITKFGVGTVTLLGSNTFGGGLTIKAGTVQVATATGVNALGSGTITLGDIANTGAGATLNFNGAGSFPTFTNAITVAGTGTDTLSATNWNPVFSGGVTLNNNLTLLSNNNSGSIITLNGSVTGTGGITSTVQGASPSSYVVLGGANNYSGGTTITSGTLKLGSTTALGATTGALKLNGGTANYSTGARTDATLNLNGNSATVGALTSTDQSSFNGFNLGSGTNPLTVSSASVSGVNYIGINNATSITSTGTYNLINSGSAMTGGGTFTFTGAQDLTVPVNSIIAKNSAGNFYRLTLHNTGTAEQVIVSNTNLGNTINIMPLGASISFGTSSTGTSKNGTVVTSYNGSGYHSQLYQNLVNDGRFNPNFVGSSTSTGAVNSSGPSILSTVGQTASEGHPGYTNSQILYNLNNNDGNSSANGGYWLKAGNGVNPTYVPLNVGGNDFTVNSSDTNAILRYDAIVTQLNTLRPGVSTIVTSLMYRTDVGTSQDTLYNPYVPGIVYNHALAGQNVRYLDLYNILTPNDSQSILSSDGIHPIQAGYDQEANAWSESLLYGAAYYKGGNNGVWNSVNGTTTNFASDSGLTTDRQKSLTDTSTRTYTGAYADVWFNNNAAALSTTLGADQTIRSLNFASGAAGAVSIGGANTLTIGAGGITVQQGTGAHTVSANVALGAAQTWGNVSSNAFTVSGIVSGSNNLTIAGSYTTYNPGSVTGVSTSGGELYTPTASTYVGSGSIVLTGSNTYTGSTTINQYGVLQIGSGGTGGSLSTSSAITDNGALTFNRSNTITQGTDFASVISGTGSVTQNGAGNLVLSGANTYSGGTTISAGTLAASSLQASGSNSSIGTGALTLGNGGTLKYTGGGFASTFGNAITVGSGGGTLDYYGGSLFTNSTFSGSGTLTYLDSSGGNHQLLYTGTSNGTFTGNIIVGSAAANSGFLQYRSSNANAFGTGSITVNAGGTFAADVDGTAGTPSTLSNAFTLNGGLLAAQSPNLTYTGPISLAATSSVGNAQAGTNGSVTLSGVVSGTGGLNKISGNTVTLSGASANTYSGLTTVTQGELDLSKTAGINAISGNVAVNGGTLKLLASNQIADTSTIGVSSGTLNFNNFSETLKNLSVSGGSVNYGTGTVNITDPTWSGGSNTVSGSTTFGELTVSGGTNTVTGAGTGGAGVLTIGGATDSVSGDKDLTFSGTGSPTITVSSDAGTAGKIVLTGNVTSTNTAGTAGIASGGSAANPGQLDLGGAARTFTVTDGSAASDLAVSTQVINGGIVKTGAGTLTLSGTGNTYSGGTTVNQGTLALSAAGADGSGTLTVNSGGTVTVTAGSATGSGNVTLNSGTLQNANTSANGSRSANTAATNNTQTLGVLMLGTGTSILDFGASNTGAIFQFADSSGAAWASGAMLNVYNWEGYYPTTYNSSTLQGTTVPGGLDQLFFGNSNTGLTMAQLQDIHFYSGYNTGLLGNGISIISQNGEISPAPEPGQVAVLSMIGLGLGGLLLRAKKRLQKSATPAA